MTKKRRARAILAALLIMIMAAGTGCGSGKSGPETSAEPEQAAPETPSATLFFASDYQAEEGFPAPSETLAGILRAGAADGKVPDRVTICGDFTNDRKLHDYQLSPEDSISEIRSVVKEECPGLDDDDMMFEQGNHDALTESIEESGLHEYDDYLIYVINTKNDFPWKQGKVGGCHAKTEAAAEKLKACLDDLISRGETRPVFIAGHVPLHFTARTSSRHTTGDNLYSSLLFDVLNEAGESLDIIFLFGHDHSKGWDCYLGGSSVYLAPGDTILIPEYDLAKMTTDTFSERTLNFTYMNTGYCGYYMNCGPDELDSGQVSDYAAADETLTGTFFEIYDDRIVISRYSPEGLHPLGWDGEGDPYKGGIDQGLIDEQYYSSRTESPQELKRNK